MKAGLCRTSNYGGSRVSIGGFEGLFERIIRVVRFFTGSSRVSMSKGWAVGCKVQDIFS